MTFYLRINQFFLIFFDKYPLHDIIALLKEGMPHEWHEDISIIYNEVERIHRCTFSRAQDLAKVLFRFTRLLLLIQIIGTC